jgi:hypothetical protein
MLDGCVDEAFDFGELGNICSVTIRVSTESLNFFDRLRWAASVNSILSRGWASTRRLTSSMPA